MKFSAELNQALDTIHENRLAEAVAAAKAACQDLDDSIRPVKLWLDNGYVSGTIHRVTTIRGVDIWATAQHVTEGDKLAGQLAEYGKCYLLNRVAAPDRPDVHFFCEDVEVLMEFKATCPSPSDAAAMLGIVDTSFIPQNARRSEVGHVSGFPHGVIDGPPQTRAISPFGPDEATMAELLWFYASGPVVGGMSGGAARPAGQSQSIGVLVATTHSRRQDYALVQLFHNEMRLELSS